jgi:hypothetical protein
MTKIDFKKEMKHLYGPSKKDFQVVEVPRMTFLMVDGHGDPNKAPEYTQAVEALYAVAYKLKFFSKKNDQDYVVPPLEGLWWAEDMESFSSSRDKSQWDWTMMIMTPDWIIEEDFQQALLEATEKKELAGKFMRKVYPFKFYTRVHMMMKARFWQSCMKSGCRKMDIHLMESTMKST